MKTLLLLSILGICTHLTAIAQTESHTPFWMTPALSENSLEETPTRSLNGRKATAPLAVNNALSAKIKVLIYRMPKDFEYEFALLVVDGKIVRPFIISTAIPTKTPITGTFPLTIETERSKPFPWRTSAKYENSPMYWAMNIDGGYYLHSTPHYGNLGRPASMGCIRASIPDAMLVFDTLSNQFPGEKAYAFIYEGVRLNSGFTGSNLLQDTLTRSGMTVDDLKNALENSKKEISAVSNGDLSYAPGIPVDAHARPYAGFVDQNDESIFPTCAGVNCWDYFGHHRAILKIKPNLLSDRLPNLSNFNLNSPIRLQNGEQHLLTELLGSSIQDLNPQAIYDLNLNLTSTSGDLKVRVCDSTIAHCWKPRGPAEGQTAKAVYPMYEVRDSLKSNSSFYLEVISGSGTLNAMTVRYLK